MYFGLFLGASGVWTLQIGAYIFDLASINRGIET